jgi:hypothetical protein
MGYSLSGLQQGLVLMADLKLDPETVWMRTKTIAQVVAITAGAVVLYMRFDNRMNNVEAIMARDAEMRANEREAIVKSVDGVRDELRKVFVDSVATRQAQAWIEMARALNRDKFPHLQWPDLPR